MPRLPRHDHPGCLHHVMNRGLARRTIIETRQDARYFLSLLARTCRRGEIEVHSYALMLTHFHLLVRSVRGELSNAMRWVQNLYVRRFNRMRRRDGPLMRGRFLSIPVSTSIYLRTVVRYNDQNPVDAGLVARPADYPHGSAQWLRQDGRGPPWLSRSLIDGLIEGYAPRMGARADAYDRVFSPRLTTRQRAWIKKRLEGKARGFDDLDNLLDGAETVSDWVRRKAMLADGTEPGVCLVDAETAEDVLLDALPDLGTIDTCPSGRLRPAAPLMRAALLRDAAGETFLTISKRMGVNASTPARLYRQHVDSLKEPAYRAIYAILVRRSLEDLHGPGIWSQST